MDDLDERGTTLGGGEVELHQFMTVVQPPMESRITEPGTIGPGGRLDLHHPCAPESQQPGA